MSVALRKVWRDLWNNKGRTLLVVLSIAVGVLAIGMIISTNTILERQLTASQIASNPAHVQLFLRGLVDDDTIQAVARIPQVDDAEGRASAGIRWKPTLDGEWQDANLVMRDDYLQQKFDIIELKTGVWPGAGAVAVEFDHVEPYHIPGPGGVIYFEVNERPEAMVISGTVRDPEQAPPPMTENAAFYVTRPVLQKLVGWNNYNEIRFTIPAFDEDKARLAADKVEDKLIKSGISAGVPFINDPQRHPAQDILDGIGLVLAVMSAMSLGLSTILVINTINAIVAQQIPQIGIMKTVGGLTPQIATLYLAGVVVYGLLSLLLAVPLGAFGGMALSQWMLHLLNVPSSSLEVLPQSLLVQVFAGLLTPVLAALWPVLQGAAVSVREAVSAYGLGTGQYGTRLLDRAMGSIQGLPRMCLLALRNTFRRAGRMLLTEITLIMAGAVFMMVISTSYSFNQTIAQIFRGFGWDVLVGFDGWQRIDEIVPLVESRPGVERAEMWVFRSGALRLVKPDGAEDVNYDVRVRAIPRDTQLFTPQLTAGRNLLPDDGHALLLNQKLAADMDANVGDQVILDLDEEGESHWTVVGLLFDLSARQATAFIHVDTYNEEVNLVGRAGVVEIRSSATTANGQEAVAKDVKEFLESKGYKIGFTDTALQNQQEAAAQFNILTTLLLIMTCLMAVVGSFGLSGTLSINVLERRREIGVMRAVGASSGDVGFIFMGEGVMLGILSWAIALPISLLAGKYFVAAISNVIKFPVIYYYSMQGAWIWLAIVVVLSLGASWLPARRATRISVRESLAYE
jgi:putative ABC transport system permease protein